MKKLFLLLTISAASLFSAQFEIIKDVTELQNDLTAARYGYKDVNGDWCAILKVWLNATILTKKRMLHAILKPTDTELLFSRGN